MPFLISHARTRTRSIMATTPEAIVTETICAESTSTPAFLRTCKGKDHFASNDTCSSVHSGTTPNTKPVFMEKPTADEQRATQVDAVEDKHNKEDTKLEQQEEPEPEPESKPVQQRPARTERPRRVAAKVTSDALRKVARVLGSADTAEGKGFQ